MVLNEENLEMVKEIIDKLRDRGESLSTAESLTGGLLSSAFVCISGASQVFQGGITAYSDAAKIAQLKVDPQLIASCSVVSHEVAIAMAKGAVDAFATTWAISTTGVAGPLNLDSHRVGEVFIAIHGPSTQSLKLNLSGEREIIRNLATSEAISAFARILRDRK